MQSETAFKLSKFGIRFKLVFIISAILTVSLGFMIALATWFFRNDNEVRVQEANMNVSRVIADNIRNTLAALIRSTTIAADLLIKDGPGAVKSRIWQGEKNLLYIGVFSSSGNGIAETSLSNDSLTVQYGLPDDFVKVMLKDYADDFAAGASGVTLLKNVSGSWPVPLLAVIVPYEKPGGARRSLVMILRSEAFLDSVQSSGITETYVTDLQGQIILHSDRKLILARSESGSSEIIKAMKESQVSNGQIRYEDTEGNAYLAAFRTLPEAGIGVISSVREDLAFEEVYNIQRRNIFLLIAVISLAVLIVWFFAKSITLPVKALVSAAREVERGNYDLNLPARSHDELGLLTHSFQSMTRGLRERENLRESFGRFVNKDIAEMSLKGQLRLGGERKECAVFFSDVRGFTAMSEKTDPAEVVDFLNEYFSAMVSCVNQTDGSVDKFIGDALMAVWGALRSVPNPSLNAVKSALLMRDALEELNENRKKQKKPPVRIGCGINTGHVIAGQIGSSEKLEYTVIGDAVNMASRTEQLSKVYAADILITENVFKYIDKEIHAVKLDRIKVKGKTQAVTIYAVLGLRSDPDSPKSIEDLRLRLGIAPPQEVK